MFVSSCVRVIRSRSFINPTRNLSTKSFGSSTTSTINASALFDTIKMAANNPQWQERGLIGSDFTSKRTLLAIHLWLVCKRISGSTNGAVMQEKLLEKFCQEKTILPKRNLRNNFLEFIGSSTTELCNDGAYQQLYQVISKNCVIKEEDPTFLSAVDDIAFALWIAVYNSNDRITLTHVQLFARYILREQKALWAIPDDILLNDRNGEYSYPLFHWGPLPDWEE